MTSVLFFTVFVAIMGFIFGKCCKGGNPFFIFVGLAVSFVPVASTLVTEEQNWYFFPYALGFLYVYINPFYWLSDALSEIKLSYQLAKAKSENQSKAQFQEEVRQAEQNIKAQAEEIRRQKAQAEEDIKRASEELRRKQEAFQRQQGQQQSNHSSSQSQFDSAGLDPRKFEDACSILGVHAGSSLAEFKKAYRHLSNLFHPDKLDKFDGVLKQQAKENAKLINIAWETIQKKLK
ncbi:J domain-containing protein [Pseudoalteromonas rubra]|uniref:J domain-containing protein n=1 Tax=Pseudoalteromonas rubra TaxID=43658 RepID=UPI002DBC6405|nr:DnaJ domain-containing protein [Pseudoalteromonas rubra]MEC4090915.1 DnaJ domain-containing protein [Pseudoalteromonas rubra]